MAVIMLYKDKSALVAVATTHLPSIPLQFSKGDIKYKFVDRTNVMLLNDPDKLN